jgi:hypothetical protein
MYNLPLHINFYISTVKIDYLPQARLAHSKVILAKLKLQMQKLVFSNHMKLSNEMISKLVWLPF